LDGSPASLADTAQAAQHGVVTASALESVTSSSGLSRGSADDKNEAMTDFVSAGQADPRDKPEDDGNKDVTSAVTIIVCSSCRDETGSEAHPCAGAVLGQRTRDAAAGAKIKVRQVECLGNCKRRLSAALLRENCWSYVFGDLTLDSGPDLVTGAELFATSTDGLIPWRGRPDSLKRGLVARIPPLDLLKDIA
jgi:predicted metal-binding protein